MAIWVPTASSEGDPIAPENATKWEVVDDPVQVEQHLINQSKLHFQQARGTPFTLIPLNEITDCSDPGTTAILQPGLPSEWKEAIPAVWNDETVHLMERMTLNSTIPVINITISMDEFKKGIKNGKKEQQNLPLGVTLGISTPFWHRMGWPTLMKKSPQHLWQRRSCRFTSS